MGNSIYYYLDFFLLIYYLTLLLNFQFEYFVIKDIEIQYVALLKYLWIFIIIFFL